MKSDEGEDPDPGSPWELGVVLTLGPISQKYELASAATAKSLQSCPTLCDLIGGSPPDSSVSGILQARILEWVAISFS